MDHRDEALESSSPRHSEASLVRVKLLSLLHNPFGDTSWIVGTFSQESWQIVLKLIRNYRQANSDNAIKTSFTKMSSWMFLTSNHKIKARINAGRKWLHLTSENKDLRSSEEIFAVVCLPNSPQSIRVKASNLDT